jgi:hypothetical protein
VMPVMVPVSVVVLTVMSMLAVSVFFSIIGRLTTLLQK